MLTTLDEFTKLLKESRKCPREGTCYALMQEHLKANQHDHYHLLEMIRGIENWSLEEVRAFHKRRIPEAMKRIEEIREDFYSKEKEILKEEKRRYLERWPREHDIPF